MSMIRIKDTAWALEELVGIKCGKSPTSRDEVIVITKAGYGAGGLIIRDANADNVPWDLLNLKANLS